MANVVKTVMTYPLNGTTRDFNIPFEYLARKFIQVTLVGVDRKVLTLNTDYRFSTKSTITTTQAWGTAQGYQQIEIRRYTSASERLVDFTDGSILRAYDLNISQIQTMHVAEEARDLTADTIGVNNEGHLDARGRRIVNLADAVNDRDAVPFGQLKGMNQNAWDAQNKALQYRNEAETFKNASFSLRGETEAFKNQASASQTAAKTSETNAKASEVAAAASKSAAAASQAAAATSATNAAGSNASAKTQADRAKTEADRAKTEADKLSNWNALAGAVDEVSGINVRWKGTLRAKGNLSADGSVLIGADGGSYMNANGLRFKSRNDALRSMDVVCWNDTANRKAVMEWTSNVGTGYLMYIEKTSDTKSKLSVNGDITGEQLTATALTTSGPHAAVNMSTANAGDPVYVLGKTANTNNWYLGKGGASDAVMFHSYKLGTTVQLNTDHVSINKYLMIANSAKVSHDGNVWGTVWGSQWLSGYLNNTFKKKTKAWTAVRSGGVGGGQSVTLTQDVRFRTIWLSINGYWHPAQIGGDGNYLISGWGSGWIKIQISNNGKTFKNIEDSGSVPSAIYVENE